MVTVGTAFDAATGDGPAANVGRMQEPTVFNNLGRAPLPERARPFELDADVTQMTPIAAAAGCSCSSLGCRDRDHNGGARPPAATCENVTKQPDAAVYTEKPQPPR